ncbi:MAG: hypothetical protein Q8S75_12035, partial [Nitrospirota bacterium]|nr:hypothetical protein [Nitrospirota bacterium]
GQADRPGQGGKPAKAKGAEFSVGAGRGGMPPTRKVWTQGPAGELESIVVQTGISDGVATEIMSEVLAESTQVIVGIERSKGEKGGSDLPPGFGSGGQKGSSRTRGM